MTLEPWLGGLTALFLHSSTLKRRFFNFFLADVICGWKPKPPSAHADELSCVLCYEGNIELDRFSNRIVSLGSGFLERLRLLLCRQVPINNSSHKLDKSKLPPTGHLGFQKNFWNRLVPSETVAKGARRLEWYFHDPLS